MAKEYVRLAFKPIFALFKRTQLTLSLNVDAPRFLKERLSSNIAFVINVKSIMCRNKKFFTCFHFFCFVHTFVRVTQVDLCNANKAQCGSKLELPVQVHVVMSFFKSNRYALLAPFKKIFIFCCMKSRSGFYKNKKIKQTKKDVMLKFKKLSLIKDRSQANLNISEAFRRG